MASGSCTPDSPCWDRHAAALTRLSDALARQRQERRAAAFELLADLLIDGRAAPVQPQ